MSSPGAARARGGVAIEAGTRAASGLGTGPRPQPGLTPAEHEATIACSLTPRRLGDEERRTGMEVGAMANNDHEHHFAFPQLDEAEVETLAGMADLCSFE